MDAKKLKIIKDKKIYFSDKELTRIKNSEKKPTSVSKENDILEDSSSTSDFDLDI